ncbi:hypothetical protein [Streptomyces sp. NPDC052721]|uniref:hypothetical protein n=1 Tax=Streptomyces sp. NPDC052721 TaxID=3154955 RepID=UPI0034267002
MVRRAAADVVGSCTSPGELTLPALLRRRRAEDDPVTRLDLVLALGRAAPREPLPGLCGGCSGMAPPAAPARR